MDETKISGQSITDFLDDQESTGTLSEKINTVLDAWKGRLRSLGDTENKKEIRELFQTIKGEMGAAVDKISSKVEQAQENAIFTLTNAIINVAEADDESIIENYQKFLKLEVMKQPDVSETVDEDIRDPSDDEEPKPQDISPDDEELKQEGSELSSKPTKPKSTQGSGLAGYVPTINRIQKYFGTDSYETELRTILDKYKKTIAGGETEKIQVLEDNQADFFTLQTRLEGAMRPPKGLDLSNKQNVQKAARERLDSMLEDLNGKEKIKERMNDDQRKALEEFIAMRMLLGQYQSVDINDEKLIEKSLMQVQEKSNLFSSIPNLDNDSYNGILSGKKIEKSYMDKIIKQSAKIGDGLYAYKSPEGKPNVLMRKINKQNIEKTLDTLSSNSVITWYGKISDKQKMEMEIATIRRGKVAKFRSGTEVTVGPYSRNMPKNPTDYAKWYENIAKEEQVNLDQGGPKQGWQKAGIPTTKHFIKEVIDSDDKMLSSFFQDISLNGNEEIKARVMNELSSDQKKMLTKSLEQREQKTQNSEEKLAIKQQKDLLSNSTESSTMKVTGEDIDEADKLSAKPPTLN